MMDAATTAAVPLLKLNLGCGYNKLDGYVNVDTRMSVEPDVWLDLESEWPWKAASVGEVVIHHVLEHIHNVPVFMIQLYAVCAPGATVVITTPHHRSDAFCGDPTHVHPITLATLRLFSKKECDMFKERGWANTPLAHYLDVDFEVTDIFYTTNPAWKGMTQEVLLRCAESFNNVIEDCRFTLRRV